MNRYQRGALYATAYLLSIVAAAAAVKYIGPVPVGFGLIAPAAAYIVGVTMVLRDLTQDQLGPWWTYGAMLVGAALSAAVSPALAVAAFAAFAVSETIDQLVYTPLRRRGLVLAVLASNAAGIVVDTVIFLWLAFGSLEFFAGQVWAKAASTLLAVVVLKLLYRRRTTMRPAYLVEREREEVAA